MDELIEALEIFKKYANLTYPTKCTTNAFHVMIKTDTVSKNDKAKLGQLSFAPNFDYQCFTSYRFGSEGHR